MFPLHVCTISPFPVIVGEISDSPTTDNPLSIAITWLCVWCTRKRDTGRARDTRYWVRAHQGLGPWLSTLCSSYGDYKWIPCDHLLGFSHWHVLFFPLVVSLKLPLPCKQVTKFQRITAVLVWPNFCQRMQGKRRKTKEIRAIVIDPFVLLERLSWHCRLGVPLLSWWGSGMDN